MALDFYGRGSVRINSPPIYINDPGDQDFTIEFWAIIDISLTNYFFDSGPSSGWAYKGLSIVAYKGSDSLYIRLFTGPKIFYKRIDISSYFDTPCHLAIVKSGDAVFIYVNGTQIDGIINPTSASYTDQLNYALIGTYWTSDYDRRGKMQEFRVWNHARTEQEINEHKDSYVEPNSPGLDLYYKLNDQSGVVVCDSSPNGRHGELNQESAWVEDFVQLDTLEPNIVTGSITFHGHSSGTFGVPIKKAVGEITFHGHSSMFMSAIKTAVGKITFHGASTMSLIGLVLRELEGIYQISSSEIFSRNQPVLSEDLANYIEVYINPLVPAAEPEEVYKSDEDNKESIPAGETKTFTVEYSEEPVIETVATLTDTGPNLSIVDTKYYGSSAEITITNSGTATQSCIIVVSGKPLEVQGRRKIVVKDEESILDHGLVKYKFDSPLVQDETAARDIGTQILRMFAVARANIEIEWRGDPALELADICQIPEYERLGISKKENFYVTKQEFTVEGGLRVSMTGRKIPQAEEEE